MLPFACAALKI